MRWKCAWTNFTAGVKAMEDCFATTKSEIEFHKQYQWQCHVNNLCVRMAQNGLSARNTHKSHENYSFYQHQTNHCCDLSDIDSRSWRSSESPPTRHPGSAPHCSAPLPFSFWKHCVKTFFAFKSTVVLTENMALSHIMGLWKPYERNQRFPLF